MAKNDLKGMEVLNYGKKDYLKVTKLLKNGKKIIKNAN